MTSTTHRIPRPRIGVIILSGLALAFGLARGATNALPDRGTLVLDAVPNAHFRFGGEVGRRVEANLNHWLLCAPAANPGILEMFRMRDRQPAPQLVPWAGEFAGKYLISAVQALRMTDSPALRAQVASFVAELIATQAEDGATIGPGQTAFRWTTKTNATLTDYRLVISDSPDFAKTVVELAGLKRSRTDVGNAFKSRLEPQRRYFWRVVACGPQGETPSAEPAAWFRFDPQAPASASADEFEPGPGGLVVKVALPGDPKPEFGRLKRATGFAPTRGQDGSANGAVRLNGHDQMLIYALPEELDEDYSISVWFRLAALPEGRIGQVFSAWAAGMDDPLRLTIDHGQLFARIEAQQGFSTKGVPIDVGVWHHVAAVKRGPQLTLYLDGRAREATAVPPFINSVARTCALGGNPNFSGNEFLAADFADFTMSLRALSADEVGALARLPAK